MAEELGKVFLRGQSNRCDGETVHHWILLLACSAVIDIGLQVSHDDHGRHDGLCDHAKDGGRVPVVDLHPIIEAVDEMVAAKHVCPAPDLGVGWFIDDAL